MVPTRLRTKNDCAGEAQLQFTGLDWRGSLCICEISCSCPYEYSSIGLAEPKDYTELADKQEF
jgi:hypothetical protein